MALGAAAGGAQAGSHDCWLVGGGRCEQDEPETEPLVPAPELQPRPRRCLVVTLGYRGDKGQRLMESWYAPAFRQTYEILDVRPYLRDHCCGGPWGTSPSTQQRVAERQGFRANVLSFVMGRILILPVVMLACQHGHHRSVAVAEIAKRKFEELGLGHFAR